MPILLVYSCLAIKSFDKPKSAQKWYLGVILGQMDPQLILAKGTVTKLLPLNFAYLIHCPGHLMGLIKGANITICTVIAEGIVHGSHAVPFDSQSFTSCGHNAPTKKFNSYSKLDLFPILSLTVRRKIIYYYE